MAQSVSLLQAVMKISRVSAYTVCRAVQVSTRPLSGQCGSLGWRAGSDISTLRWAQVSFHFKHTFDGFIIRML